MALYWPEKRVAFDVVDDPLADHVPDEENWKVVYATLEELSSFESYDRVMKRIARALDVDDDTFLEELDLYEPRRRALFEQLKA